MAKQDLKLLSRNASYPYGVSILVYSPLDPSPTRENGGIGAELASASILLVLQLQIWQHVARTGHMT